MARKGKPPPSKQKKRKCPAWLARKRRAPADQIEGPVVSDSETPTVHHNSQDPQGVPGPCSSTATRHADALKRPVRRSARCLFSPPTAVSGTPTPLDCEVLAQTANPSTSTTAPDAPPAGPDGEATAADATDAGDAVDRTSPHAARRGKKRGRGSGRGLGIGQGASPIPLDGRRIVDLSHYTSEMRRLAEHNPERTCGLGDMDVVKETRRGLRTCWTYKCRVCTLSTQVWSEPKSGKKMGVNLAAVAGTMLSGGGHAQLQQMLSALNMPCMDDKTFASYEEKLLDALQITGLDLMKQAVEEEAQIARDLGHVDEDGTPLLTVTGDGCWPKRSSRTNYSSLAGTAAIVGVYTKKVLWFGWRNKFCVRCERAAKKIEEPAPHRCFMNWSGSATSMESDIIVEGFRCSEELYGVRYKWFVGDGDSSTYSKLLLDPPYDFEIEKIECSNHLLRNFCYSLEEIVKLGDNKRGLKAGQTKGLRLNISRKILKMRCAIVKAAEHWRSEEGPLNRRVINLKKDILNVPRHTFGDHSKCEKYFCTGKRKPLETNLTKTLQKNHLWKELIAVFDKLSAHCRSLIHCQNNNAVENLNSIICKVLGGKRINFTQRSSYVTRVTAATVSKNSNHRPFRALHKQLCQDESPCRFAKRAEERTAAKRGRARERLAAGEKTRRRRGNTKKDRDYGNAPQKVYRVKEDILDELADEASRWEDIERDTRLQSAATLWHRLRLFRLTASVFGSVCKRQPSTLCDALVKNFLYGEFSGNEHTAHGKKFEKRAIREFSEAEGITVLDAGLFIDRDLHYLGASPDGVVDDGEGLVEVKCPSTFSKLTPEEAVRRKADVALKIDDKGNITLKKNHNHYYQIQGQMHIARKSYTWYVVWTTKGFIKMRVPRDDTFWDNCMRQQLKDFYFECLLVEIVEQNYLLGKPIKNPQRILNAHSEKMKQQTANKEKKANREAAKQKKIEENLRSGDDKAVGNSVKKQLKRKNTDTLVDEHTKKVAKTVSNTRVKTPAVRKTNRNRKK